MMRKEPDITRWIRRIAAGFIARAGLDQLGHFVIWIVVGMTSQTVKQSVTAASGVLLLALAAALWVRRAIRPILLASVPLAVIATALSYRVALAERGIAIASRQAVPMWVAFAVFVIVATYAARWVWRQDPRGAR
jgi:hypothetical protein